MSGEWQVLVWLGQPRVLLLGQRRRKEDTKVWRHFPEWVRMRRLLFPGRLGVRREDQSRMRSLGVSHHAGGEAHVGYGGRVDPGEPPNFIVAPFHRPSIPPKGGLPPGSQRRDRFLRDLGWWPVLLWTAHSAAVDLVAAPGATRGRMGGCPPAPGPPARRPAPCFREPEPGKTPRQSRWHCFQPRPQAPRPRLGRPRPWRERGLRHPLGASGRRSRVRRSPLPPLCSLLGSPSSALTAARILGLVTE